LKTRLKTKETKYTVVFVKYLERPQGILRKQQLLNKVMFSVFGRFIEDYLRNLTCWKKSMYAVVINSSKSIKNS
jgi:hypothetical protein